MERRGSQHAVAVRMLCRLRCPKRVPGPGQPLDLHQRRPPSLCPANTVLSFVLLKKWVVDLVLEGRRGGKQKKENG